MKICKNCGRETTDDKVRCPHCGYLFESDMDDMLRRMRSNLDSYKQEMAVAAPPQGAPVPAQQNAAPQGAAQPYAQQTSDKERFELLTEVAQLKGEVNALHGEISRMQAARAQYDPPPQGAQQGSDPCAVHIAHLAPSVSEVGPLCKQRFLAFPGKPENPGLFRQLLVQITKICKSLALSCKISFHADGFVLS